MQPTPCADAAARSAEAGKEPSMRVRPCTARKGGRPTPCADAAPHRSAYGVERVRLTQRADVREFKRFPLSFPCNKKHAHIGMRLHWLRATIGIMSTAVLSQLWPYDRSSAPVLFLPTGKCFIPSGGSLRQDNFFVFYAC